MHRAGVPLAGTRSGVTPGVDAIAAAVQLVQPGWLEPRERDALAAFVLAWRQHWPTSFAAGFGGDAARLVAWARSACPDPGRLIKLRRIALANLASVL
ncbi:MAG: hypothetical protein IT370_00750 [Deltaproteobacteria bacterium]|nr:hypothetical protein [Deltaproteobacteria bacterium]